MCNWCNAPVVHDVQLVPGVPVAVIESAVEGAGYALAVVGGTGDARKWAPGILIALARLDSLRSRFPYHVVVSVLQSQ